MLLPWLCFTLQLTTAIAKPTLNVLVISDFSLAFVRPQSLDRSLLPSGPFVCPSSAYPDALSQFQFTSDIIADVDRTIPMNIQYYVYSGGDGDPISNILSSRNNFTETSIPAYTKFCAEGPEDNDFERFIKLTITPSINTDLLILFTAAPQAQIDNALPILSKNVKKVIVLGLNERDVSKAYPHSSVTLTDFTEPEHVSCMVNELYETIHGKFGSGGDVDAVTLCYPNIEQTTMIATTETIPPRPPMSILFINDFTTNFVGDDSMAKNIPISKSSYGKCPAGMYPQAGNEFNFTMDIVNGIRADANLDLMFYEYNGGGGSDIPMEVFSRDNFATEAGNELREACMDDHYPSDLGRFTNRINDAVGDVLVLFTTEPIPNGLHLDHIRRYIIVGLNGVFTYDDNSISITDFSPSIARGISCMIDRLWDDINDNSLLGCFDTTLAPERTVVPTTVEQTTPSTRILFINDFTSDFMMDDARALRAGRPSNAIKCPGNSHPEAAAEFDFTSKLVHSLPDNLTMEIFYYANNGEQHPIPPSIDPKNFDTETEFKDVVCFEDNPLPSDLNKLSQTIDDFESDLNILVLFSAVTLAQPLSISTDVGRIIAVGLNGADQSYAYPDSYINIDNFDNPESVSIISCMINAALNGETNLRVACELDTPLPKSPMSILFINDFTTDFVGDNTMVKNVPTSNSIYGKCPGGAYVQAGNEFNYTVDIVNGVKAEANLILLFSEYLGGWNFHLESVPMTRDDFAQKASNILRDACQDEHSAPDYDALATQLSFVRTDILVLFTTTQLDKPLNLPAANFGRIIVVGLNGANESKAYPDSSISITDFSRPQVVSCMIDKLWDDIASNSLLSCAN